MLKQTFYEFEPTSRQGILSAAWPRGSERRFYDGHDRKADGSTPTQASLLRPYIRCFTIIIPAWSKQRQLLSKSAFVL